jgi:hypothetical protein
MAFGAVLIPVDWAGVAPQPPLLPQNPFDAAKNISGGSCHAGQSPTVAAP